MVFGRDLRQRRRDIELRNGRGGGADARPFGGGIAADGREELLFERQDFSSASSTFRS